MHRAYNREKKYEGLEGLERIYENEMIELNKDEEYKEELKRIIKDIEEIFNEKKSRKKREKKKISNQSQEKLCLCL